MRLFSFLFLAVTVGHTLFGQNVVILKSGEKLNGKVERYNKDTLTFSFKGNKMQFKSSEIVSIYFDEKAIDKEKPNPTTIVSEQKGPGSITGVVTYYYNSTYGDKPDIGAEILIIDVNDAKDFKYLTVDSFTYSSTYKALYDSYAKEGKPKIPDNISKEVKRYGVNTNEGFDALDKRAKNELDKIQFKNIIYCTKLTVDGNGNFSANVPAGSYYVYIKSNNRKRNSLTEVMGKVSCQKITVRSDETSNVNVKFDIY